MLAVARVARTRYYESPSMVAAAIRAADPVVTSNGDRLRFESFSACCGVYARFDALRGCLDATTMGTGTTNVDVNAPLRAALARIGGLDPLHVTVGGDVTVTTFDGPVVEKKVPLPERWLRGFAEVQRAAAGMIHVFDAPGTEARRFLRSLPSGGTRATQLHVSAAGRGLRLTSRADHRSVPVAGPERLRALEPLLRFAGRLHAYAPTADGAGRPAASVWVLDLDDARFVLALSPEISRGFSGEGGVLWDLADDDSAADADLVLALLSFEPRVDIDHLRRETGLPADRVNRAMSRLAAAGRVGYDVSDAAYFHRELPYDIAALDAMHPRLRDARALVAAGAIRLDGDLAFVRSGAAEHVVRRTDSGPRCTCPWDGKYKGSRGPCKHVLAADLSQRAVTTRPD